MKPTFRILSGHNLALLLPSLVFLCLCASCPKKSTSTSTLDSATCKFIAGFADLGDARISIFRDQIRAFNEKYSIYRTSTILTGPEPIIGNPYMHMPHILRNDLNTEPNLTIRTLMNEDKKWGLLLGFGKPSADKNEIALYIQLVNEDLTRISEDTCKVDYSFVQQSGAIVYFKYDASSKSWVNMEKAEVDNWANNLYGADKDNVPAYKGYYIHHSYGNVPEEDQYFYLGLKAGSRGDTLNIFSMKKPLNEIISHDSVGHASRDISIQDEHFHGTAVTPNASLLFRSATDEIPSGHTVIRACPPHCPR